MADDKERPADPAFEDVVAALLQVDPTGITGQRGKRRDDEDEDPPRDA